MLIFVTTITTFGYGCAGVDLLSLATITNSVEWLRKYVQLFRVRFDEEIDELQPVSQPLELRLATNMAVH